MINFDDVAKENIKDHNPNRPQIPDYPYKILIIGGSGFGKTNSLFNVISHQANIDKIYLYAKESYEANHHLLTNKRESAGLKHFNDSRAFIYYFYWMIWMIFINILKNTTQIRNGKYLLFLMIYCWYA